MCNRERFMSEQSRTGVEVIVGSFPGGCFLHFCTPRIEIDGTVHKKPWGTHFFKLTPGRHLIRVWYRYLFMPRCGLNGISIEIEEGETCRLKYNGPLLAGLRGALKRV
jgi:hypothetical protein